MPATRYLKNAWAKKDADSSYWLFIQGIVQSLGGLTFLCEA
jgi:hypothetical protein